MSSKPATVVFVAVVMGLSFAGCECNQAVLARIYKCSDREAAPIYFKMDESIDLCCDIRSNECNNTDLNDTLSLGIEGRVAGSLSRLDPCTVRLDIENASAPDQGRYRCSKNDETMALAIEDVIVVEKPKEPEIKKFIVSQGNAITVKFCGEDSAYLGTDWYEVSITRDRDIVKLCDMLQSNTSDSSKRCLTCKYKSPGSPAHGKVSVSVRVHRHIQIVEAKQEFEVMAHIRPGRMKKLTVTDTTSNAAIFKFCLSSLTERLYGFMNLVGSPLSFHLQLDRMQGIPQRLTVYFNSTPYFPCMAVRLQNLTAFTNYLVSVSGIGGGGEGGVAQINFTSEKSVPSKAPHLDQYSYMIDTYEDHQLHLKSALVLYWEELPQADRGGSNVTYTLEIKVSDDYTQQRKNIQDPFKVITLDYISDPLVIRLWAVNELGTSEKYTEMFFPGERELTKAEAPEAYVEFNEPMTQVLVKPPLLQTGIEQVAIHWCKKQRYEFTNNLDLCQEYPKTYIDNLKTDYQIRLMEEIVHEETEEKTFVQYYKLTSLKKELKDPETAPAIIKLNPAPTKDSISKRRRRRSTEVNSVLDKGTSLLPQEDFQDISSSDFPSDLTTAFDPYPTVTTPGQRAAGTKSPTEGFDRASKVYSVFVSFFRNGVWSGMVRTKCNYDAALTEVQLTLSQTFLKSKVLLEWKQTCDNEPAQFLADFFQVFASPDKDCSDANEDVVKIGNITDNSIFSTSSAEVPAGHKYACVRAYRNKSSNLESYKSNAFVHTINYEESAKGSDNAQMVTWIAIVCVIIGILIIAGVSCCVRINYRKRNHFKRLGDQECLSVPPSPDCDTQHFRPASPPWNQSFAVYKNPSGPDRTNSQVESSNDSGNETICSDRSDQKNEGQTNTLLGNGSISEDVESSKKDRDSGVTDGLGTSTRSLKASETFQTICTVEVEKRDLSNVDRQGDEKKSNFKDIQSERGIEEEESGESKAEKEDCEENESCGECEEMEGEEEEELGLTQARACLNLGITFNPDAVSLESDEDEDNDSGGIVNNDSGSSSNSFDRGRNVKFEDKDNTGGSDSGCDARGKISSGSSANTSSVEDLHPGGRQIAQSWKCTGANRVRESLEDLDSADSEGDFDQLRNGSGDKFNSAHSIDSEDIFHENCDENSLSIKIKYDGSKKDRTFDMVDGITLTIQNDFNGKDEMSKTAFEEMDSRKTSIV